MKIKLLLLSCLLIVPSLHGMDKEAIQKMTPDELMAYRLEKGRELNTYIDAHNAIATAALLDDLQKKEVAIDFEAFLVNAHQRSSMEVVSAIISRLPKEMLQIALWRELSRTSISSCIPPLVEAGAQINQYNIHGLTPLANVVQQANTRRVKEILTHIPQLNFSYQVAHEFRNIFYLARENYQLYKLGNRQDMMREYQAIGKALTLYEGMFSQCALISKNGLVPKVPKDIAKIIAMHADYSMLD